MRGFFCTARIYEYKGREFEYSPHMGAWPIRKDGEPYKRVGEKWWEFIGEFLDLPEEGREAYRVGGGCIPFVS